MTLQGTTFLIQIKNNKFKSVFNFQMCPDGSLLEPVLQHSI
jgi:hypothetical protein